MTIQEAVRKAVEIDGYITTPDFWGKFKVIPTRNEPFGVSFWDGSHPCKHGWNVTYDDFFRDDWLVVDKAEAPDLPDGNMYE